MRSVRLAIVGDGDVAAREALAQQLAAHDLAVVRCGDGRRLWDLVVENRDVQVVFADALLPGLDGAALARRLAATRDLRQVPVVVTAVATDPASKGRLLAIGVAAVIPRAPAPAELQAALLAAGRAAERRLLSSSTLQPVARRAHGPRPSLPSNPTEVTP